MKKRIGEVIIIIVFVFFASFWGWNRYMNEQQAVLEIIYIPKTTDSTNEFWSSLLAGARVAAEEENVKLTIAAPEKEEDYEKQNELILWAIEQKPDAILISACDYTGNLEAVRKVRENKIPLVFVDSDVYGDIGDSMVATDNFIAGVKMGELAKQSILGEKQIAIVGHVKNSSTAMERIEGIQYELEDSGLEIVEVVYCDSNYDRAEEMTSRLIEDYPNLGLIIGTNEYAAVGAARAVKKLGYQDQIHMIGFDSSIEQVQFLEEQIFDGIVIQKAFNMGYLGVEQAVAIVRGEPYQKNIDSGSTVITLENMQEPENQKLLFPFVGKQYRENIQNEP